jgi:adenylyltransferase/sulfurtransferase
MDVREPHELAICGLGGLHIPLGELPRRVSEVDRSREVVVYCRSGARSGRAVAFLRQQGVARAVNLAGGVLAWADRVDPTMPRY